MTFEAGLSGIQPSAECLSYQWAEGVSVQVPTVQDIAEDNFSKNDSGTISEAISKLQEIDSNIDGTHLLYDLDTSKKASMAEIINLMTEFKAKKTSLDASILKEAMGRYNDNLELAQKQYYYEYLVSLCNAYNGSESRLILSVTLFNTKTGNSRHMQVGYWSGDSFQQTGNQMSSDEDITNKEFDSIDIGSCGGAGDIGSVNSANQKLQHELQKRGIGYDTIPDRPGDTR